ncbi:class I SAM-dependent RNA methyltransferase, partial [Rhizobium leguminosarum]|nr:class I SAM-dependent RNA methyltransferase [Rhizobium ruizarguesonis]
PMWNGPIECRMFRFDMVRGAVRARAQGDGAGAGAGTGAGTPPDAEADAGHAG